MKKPFPVGCAAAILSAILVAEPAGAASVTFTVVPGYVKARRILAYHFESCLRMRRDPWSHTSCPHWDPIGSGQPVDLAGRFCIYAEWPGNRFHRGALVVERLAPRFTHPIRPNATGSKGDCA